MLCACDHLTDFALVSEIASDPAAFFNALGSLEINTPIPLSLSEFITDVANMSVSNWIGLSVLLLLMRVGLMLARKADDAQVYRAYHPRWYSLMTAEFENVGGFKFVRRVLLLQIAAILLGHPILGIFLFLPASSFTRAQLTMIAYVVLLFQFYCQLLFWGTGNDGTFVQFWAYLIDAIIVTLTAGLMAVIFGCAAIKTITLEPEWDEADTRTQPELEWVLLCRQTLGSRAEKSSNFESWRYPVLHALDSQADQFFSDKLHSPEDFFSITDGKMLCKLVYYRRSIFGGYRARQTILWKQSSRFLSDEVSGFESLPTKKSPKNFRGLRRGFRFFSKGPFQLVRGEMIKRRDDVTEEFCELMANDPATFQGGCDDQGNPLFLVGQVSPNEAGCLTADSVISEYHRVEIFVQRPEVDSRLKKIALHWKHRSQLSQKKNAVYRYIERWTKSLGSEHHEALEHRGSALERGRTIKSVGQSSLLQLPDGTVGFFAHLRMDEAMSTFLEAPLPTFVPVLKLKRVRASGSDSAFTAMYDGAAVNGSDLQLFMICTNSQRVCKNLALVYWSFILDGRTHSEAMHKLSTLAALPRGWRAARTFTGNFDPKKLRRAWMFASLFLCFSIFLVFTGVITLADQVDYGQLLTSMALNFCIDMATESFEAIVIGTLVFKIYQLMRQRLRKRQEQSAAVLIQLAFRRMQQHVKLHYDEVSKRNHLYMKTVLSTFEDQDKGSFIQHTLRDAMRAHAAAHDSVRRPKGVKMQSLLRGAQALPRTSESGRCMIGSGPDSTPAVFSPSVLDASGCSQPASLAGSLQLERRASTTESIVTSSDSDEKRILFQHIDAPRAVQTSSVRSEESEKKLIKRKHDPTTITPRAVQMSWLLREESEKKSLKEENHPSTTTEHEQKVAHINLLRKRGKILKRALGRAQVGVTQMQTERLRESRSQHLGDEALHQRAGVASAIPQLMRARQARLQSTCAAKCRCVVEASSEGGARRPTIQRAAAAAEPSKEQAHEQYVIAHEGGARASNQLSTSSDDEAPPDLQPTALVQARQQSNSAPVSNNDEEASAPGRYSGQWPDLQKVTPALEHGATIASWPELTPVGCDDVPTAPVRGKQVGVQDVRDTASTSNLDKLSPSSTNHEGFASLVWLDLPLDA